MNDLIERMRLLELDHEPDGWTAVQMRDITALLDALEVALEDAERLDWLEEQAQTSRTGVSIDYIYDAEDGYVNEKGYRFMRHRFIGPIGKTVRKAIDQARRVEVDAE